MDRYPESANSNLARVNIFHLTSAVSDYDEKFLFMNVSEDDSEIVDAAFKTTIINSRSLYLGRIILKCSFRYNVAYGLAIQAIGDHVRSSFFSVC